MAQKPYSKEIARIVEDFLINDDWNYSFDEERGLFKFGLSLKSKLKSINYIVDIKTDACIVYATAPVGADSKNREEIMTMAEFICRANYGLKNGSFELDMRDGEIRYKSYIDCDDQLPSEAIIKNSVYITAMMFDRYAPGITGIIFAGMDAETAVDISEREDEEDSAPSSGGSGDLFD